MKRSYSHSNPLWKFATIVFLLSGVSKGFQTVPVPSRRTTITSILSSSSVSPDCDSSHSDKQKARNPSRNHAKRSGSRSTPERNKNNSSRSRRENTVASSSSQSSSQSSYQTSTSSQRRHATVQFNKWLHRSVRTKGFRAHQAEKALRERIDQQQPFDNISFNICLNAWAHERSREGAQRADRLFQLLKDVYHEQNSPHFLRPDTYTYAAVLNAHAKSGGGRDVALRAEQILQQAEDSILIRSDVCYNAVMDAWSSSRSPEAGDRAEALLKRLEQHEHIQPTRWAYNAVIKAWAKTPLSTDGGNGRLSNSNNSNAHKAQAILDRMQYLFESGENLQVKPDKYSFTTTIDAWAKSNAPDAADRAESLLRTMEQRHAESLGEPQNSKRHRKEAVDVQPDVITYTTVLAAYAKSSTVRLDPHVASWKAMDLLQRLERYSSSKPNGYTYNALIHLFAKHEAPEHAESILRQMIDMYKSGNKDVRPDKVTYTTVISSYANRGTRSAAEHAEALLDEMEDLYISSQDDRYLPNAQTFASVLNAYAKSGATDAQDRADRLLQRMDALYKRTGKREDLKPNTIVFSQMFQILSNSGHISAADHAERLLSRMQQLHDEYGYRDMRPNATTYAYLINAYTKSGSPKAADRATEVLQFVESRYAAGEENLKPTNLLYSAVLQSYAKTASKSATERAESLLQRNKKLFYEEGVEYAKPSVLCYNAVMDAWARSGDPRAAQRGEELLYEMESLSKAGDVDMKPRTRSYNAVIFAWKNSNAPNATDHAEAILKQMNEKCKEGDSECRPDRVTINSIISVWAKSEQEGAAERAASFLRFMEKMCNLGDPGLKPDKYSYNSVIDAFARSSDLSNAAHRANELYLQMKKLYEAGDAEMKPDIITYTSLENAWSKSKDPAAPQHLIELRELMSNQQGSGNLKHSKDGALE